MSVLERPGVLLPWMGTRLPGAREMRCGIPGRAQELPIRTDRDPERGML
jgi:hypothetical protein